jgi:hypothetical protein
MEAQIKQQIGENAKNGIYEVFVNNQVYNDYMGLGPAQSPNFNTKMYAVIWDGEIPNICLTEARAWAELISIAKEEGVSIN